MDLVSRIQKDNFFLEGTVKYEKTITSVVANNVTRHVSLVHVSNTIKNTPLFVDKVLIFEESV